MQYGDWRKQNPEVIPHLENSELPGRDLRAANFNNTYLRGVILVDSDLRHANFKNADLSIVDFSRANLSGANLSNAYARGADLIKASLREAILFRINLQQAKLHQADLYKANLEGADLRFADISSAKLRGANLSWTNLASANFTESYCPESNFEGAIFNQTILINSNLSEVKNLDTCRHHNWSTIDHHTIAQSGNLPLEFLRGCGLPDAIIETVPVLQGNPIQFYSCFISHSTKDQAFATRLYSDLQNNGVRCWYAPEDILGGKKLFDQINEAIRIHDKLLLVLSEHSMNSNWVATEIKKARTREKQEGKQMLFPISIIDFKKIKQWELFDSDEGRDLASEIRSYYIPDFSFWKNHDGYNKEFQKLIKSLKEEKIQ